LTNSSVFVNHETGYHEDQMPPLAQLLGESPAIARLRDQVSRLLQRQTEGARRRAPILILGETGTGKGLLAGAIHGAGPRAAGPFVDVNCAAIPGALLEAELFGFERGAFTDARQAKAGLFQTAHRGTLFLDEVGLLPEGLQAKLLKVLEEQTVRRLGSTRNETVDVWLIAATSEDLETAVKARRFREDLYHRLAVVTLHLPPLRERGEDIQRLAEHFLGRACEDYGLAARTLSADARASLQAYRWPGNVRELANVIERVALLSDGTTVTAATLALPSLRAQAAPGASGAEERRAVVESAVEAERGRVLEALRAVKWNVSEAAVRLGMPRNTLRYRIDKLGLGQSTPTSRRPAQPVETPPIAAEDARPLAAPSDAAAGVSLRWEPRRVTLLRGRLLPHGAKGEASETRQIMEVIVDKVRSFGGQIDALATTGLVGAFGLAPLENAARHAASCALAIQKVVARAHDTQSVSPAVALTIHTALVLVADHSGGHEIDADAKRPLLAMLEALGEQTDGGAVIVSADAAAFLARRFELTAGVPTDVGEVYRLIGPVSPERTFTTAFVGREAELGLLVERFRQAEAGHRYFDSRR
jgi:DNA-binding NtrC family response regulator